MEGFATEGAPNIGSGVPNAEGARAATEAMERAALACREGSLDAVVTGPVSKAVLKDLAGFSFPGQTEFFAHHWGGEPVMGFIGDKLRVILATWHVPLGQVFSNLSEAVLRRSVAAADRLCRLSMEGSAPAPDLSRIAVCGLNPHAGESGLLGEEEQVHLDPWLDSIREEFPGVSRTLAADTVFHRSLQGEFDAVVALYHDQGLAPLKTVQFERSVNITLGLPWTRTSPDHGTAYAIAGKGVANPSSFMRAVQMAEALATHGRKDERP